MVNARIMTPLETAQTQIGVQELTGNNDGVPASRYMRGDKLAWCAGFVLWCLEQSGDKRIAPNDKEHYRCRLVRTLILRSKEIGLHRDKGYQPKPGDLIFFGNGAVSDVGRRGNHVGIVEGFCDVKVVHTIEGNTSNKVARRSYPHLDGRIIGYACL